MRQQFAAETSARRLADLAGAIPPTVRGSADLSYPLTDSPCLVGGPDVGIQPIAERHARR
jgi:hypothetical protein